MDKIKDKLIDFKAKISKISTKIRKNISNNVAEILLFAGILSILVATFLINFIVFLYVLGVILVIFSLLLAKFYGKEVK